MDSTNLNRPHKKRKINDATSSVELPTRTKKAKAAAGPVRIDPTPSVAVAAANQDIDKLNLTQLKHETVRLEARLKAVHQRIENMLTTKRRRKTKCSAEGCTNVAQKAGVCKRHGAQVNRKKCEYEGCTNNAQRGGVCFSHGATYKLCSVEGCPNKVQQGGLCCRHGAKVKSCQVQGCRNNAQKGGLCQGCNGKRKMEQQLLSEEEESVESY